MKQKRAIEPVIATVMLIGISIAASSTIFLWMRGFFGEEIMKFDEPIETACQEINFDASISGPRTGGVYDLVVDNIGNEKISALNIKIKGINSKVESFEIFVGKGETKSVDIIGLTISPSDEIEITPLLLGKGVRSSKGKLYVCRDKIKTTTLL